MMMVMIDNKCRFVLTKVDYTPRPKKSKKKKTPNN